MCQVRFEADPSDPDTHIIEVMYEVTRPAEDDFCLETDPHFLERLSCTRTDTRETVTLLTEDLEQVKRVAIQKIAESKIWGT